MYNPNNVPAGGAPGAPAPMPQGGPPPQAGAPMPPQGGPPPGVDPKNAIQLLLIQRIAKLPPQMKMALQNAPPPVIAALMAMLPELKFVFDKIMQMRGAGGGAPMPPQAGPPGMPPPGGAPMQRPPMAGPPAGGPPGMPPRPQGGGLRRF